MSIVNVFLHLNHVLHRLIKWVSLGGNETLALLSLIESSILHGLDLHNDVLDAYLQAGNLRIMVLFQEIILLVFDDSVRLKLFLNLIVLHQQQVRKDILYILVLSTRDGTLVEHALEKLWLFGLLLRVWAVQRVAAFWPVQILHNFGGLRLLFESQKLFQYILLRSSSLMKSKKTVCAVKVGSRL